METSTVTNEPQAHHINQAAEGLDNQSFFDAQKSAEAYHQTIPAEFIMQRMLRKD